MSNTDPIPNPFLSSRFYDRMNFFTRVMLPALGSLYFGLGNLWGLPKIEEVVGSAAIIGTFLGLILGVSSSQFKTIARINAKVEEQKAESEFGGYISSARTDEDTGQPIPQLTFTKLPGEVLEGDVVRFKVGQAPPPPVG